MCVYHKADDDARQGRGADAEQGDIMAGRGDIVEVGLQLNLK